MATEWIGLGVAGAAAVKLKEARTASEVAAMLKAAGVRGRRGACNDCPISRFVKRECGPQYTVFTSGGHVGVFEKEQYRGGFDLGEPLREFIRFFDFGAFPEVAEEPERYTLA
jgi:hypothetical protein